VPAAANITSVKLKMYSQDVTQAVTAKASNTDWTEGALTWNNKPSVGSTLDTNTPSASSWVEFDVNSHVTGNGTYSFCLQASTDTPQQFDSKENTHDPVLEVTYQLETTPPAAPTGLVATAGDTEIYLHWNSNTESDFSHYSVWRDTSSGGPYTEIASNVDSNDYNDIGLSNGTTYYYVVTAFDTYDNESNDSNEASAAPQNLNPPAAPTGLAATAGNAQVSLDWDDNTEGDFADYSVWRSTTSGSSYSEVASGLTTSAYTNTGLTNGTTYYYVVTAFDTADNESDDSSEASAKPQAGGTVEFNPTDDSYANHNLPTTNYGSANYMAVRGDGTSKGRNTFLKFTVTGVTGSVTSAKLKMYSVDVTQSVTAKASNTNWTEGALTWNNQPSTSSTLDTKTPSATSWVEFDVTTHVTGNGTYSICLQGSNDGAGHTFDSKEATNDPVLEVTYGDDVTAPAAPTGLTATAGDTEVLLDWADNSEPDLASYSVWRDTSTGGPYTEIASGLTTSAYTDTGRTNGTTYYYVVTAFDDSNNESSDSSEASATPHGILEFNPSDDALVNHNLPNNNYGSDTYLAIRSDVASKGRNTFLKFTVSGVSGTVTSAKLKMYSQTVEMTATVKAVSNTSWTEGAITWNNQPSAGSTLDTKVPGTAQWVEFDVTSHVTGNGTYSFRLSGNVDTGHVFDSKEATNKPVLIVDYQ
jgi:hypothetical protein